MKAIIFPAAGTISIAQVADPTPKPDEVVVQVTMSGICGTDLHIYHQFAAGQTLKVHLHA